MQVAGLIGRRSCLAGVEASISRMDLQNIQDGISLSRQWLAAMEPLQGWAWLAGCLQAQLDILALMHHHVLRLYEDGWPFSPACRCLRHQSASLDLTLTSFVTDYRPFMCTDAMLLDPDVCLFTQVINLQAMSQAPAFLQASCNSVDRPNRKFCRWC